jgi:hypothetical protein
LGQWVVVIGSALVVPLGTAALEAVTLLPSDGLLDPERCLLGFPHPSTNNGWRVWQYTASRGTLRDEVAQWAAINPS